MENKTEKQGVDPHLGLTFCSLFLARCHHLRWPRVSLGMDARESAEHLRNQWKLDRWHRIFQKEGSVSSGARRTASCRQKRGGGVVWQLQGSGEQRLSRQRKVGRDLQRGRSFCLVTLGRERDPGAVRERKRGRNRACLGREGEDIFSEQLERRKSRPSGRKGGSSLLVGIEFLGREIFLRGLLSLKQVSRGVRGSWRLVTERRGIPEEASCWERIFKERLLRERQRERDIYIYL